jgi:septum formation protein
MKPSLYLASQSPRRKQLLEQWGVHPELLLPDADEDVESLEVVRGAEAPATYVQRVTALKLQASLDRLQRRGLPPAPVLCADTTVALGRRILGKPADAAEARAMLRDLAGRTHRVLTAVAVGVPGRRAGVAPRLAQALSVSTVSFAPLTRSQIDRYVASGEPMGKAGAYALQGAAALWVSRMTGSHSGIVGLPAFETAQVLRQAGIDLY